jgi:hypothetical protein
MTCEEFERVLPELEGDHNAEQEQHLKSCSHCSDLVADLNAIVAEAHFLAGEEEPSPRVWNSLEIALRREGLIRDSRPELVSSPPRARWKPIWLAPLAACLLVVFGLLIYERGGIAPQTAHQEGSSNSVSAELQPEAIPAEQDQLLKMVEARAPAMRAGYESEFRAVNAYIRDAESSARSNPNDEIAQQYLTNAYEQRAMLYQMAMDRGVQ